jgi:nitrogen-specific signal transduction histidine kinase/CheY-like chemotaxis protein
VFEEDRITGFIAGQQDVTARNRAAEEHRRLDERIARIAKMEALGTLAGGIAHDFNNILSVVLSHADLLERINEGLPRAARPIATIKQAVRRGAVLSRHILTFARRTEVDLAEVNVATLIDELAGMLAETFPRTIKVSVELDSGLPRVMADAGQLHQALLNLSINARDAMPNGGTLRIAAHSVSPSDMKRILDDSDVPEGVCIEVADEGVGMDEETQRRMFEPFFTTKEVGKGTGLGLALVYGVVKGHHGFVDVESRPGAGTRFFIYLPRGKNAAPSDRKESLPDAASGTESLLLIEDEAALCEALSIELCRHGYQVITAENGVRAIELFNDTTRSIDLVVTDLGMPEMSAVDLIAALRAIMPRVPIIGMTGYLGPEFHAAVLAAGAECIVQKPFGIDDLLRAIREVLDRRQ